MADISFDPVNKQGEKADFSLTTPGNTLDLDMFNMTVDVRFHDRCNGVVREPNFSKSIDQIFGPAGAARGVREVGIRHESGRELMDAAKTAEGKAAIETAIKGTVAEVLGNFCLDTDSVELRHLKTNDH